MSSRQKKWTKKQYIESIQLAHKKWTNIKKSERPNFNSVFLGNNFSDLDSAINSKYSKFKTYSELYEASGINPDCHLGNYKYGDGKKGEKAKKIFISVLNEVKNTFGVESLNDNNMGSRGGNHINIPKALKVGRKRKYTLCDSSKCELNILSLSSIYAQGRRFYGTWKNAVEAIGISYEDVLKKVAARERSEYIEMFARYIKKTKKWSFTTLRKDRNDIYRGLFNSKNHSPLIDYENDVTLSAFIEAMHISQESDGNIIGYYKKNSSELKKYFYENILIQNVWGQGRKRSESFGGDYKRIQEELIERYSKMKRITRGELENSGVRKDKTLISAMRRRSSSKDDFNSSLRKSGFLSSNLMKLYSELDEKYTTKNIYEQFCRLFKESIEHKENRLSREYNSRNEVEFHNAIIRKFKSWENGLKSFGIDPKMYTITPKKRTKRGYVFQSFFEEMLTRYGFVKATDVQDLKKSKTYIPNKFYPGCRHKIKCKPDFLFENLIIDVKTGYAAKRQQNQLERYTSHCKKLIIVTLNQKARKKMIKGKEVSFISFDDFIKNSTKIVGVKIESLEKTLLTEALKLEPWWG